MRAGRSRSEIRELLDRHGVRPTKARGQHFLADPNLVDRIVRFAGVGEGDQVVEVGAGTGVLTAALAEAGASVVAYEVDHTLRAVLEEVLADRPNADLRFADVMEVDLGADLPAGTWTLVANLPYHIGTPLILEILRHVPRIERLVVMVQREVADRLLAGPGSRVYGLPSVVVGLHAEAKFGFPVPPQVFFPRPEVESAVVELRRIPAHPASERAITLAAAAFGMRRKMLRRSLAGEFDDPSAALAAAGIDPTSRAEDLGPGQWLDLAQVV